MFISSLPSEKSTPPFLPDEQFINKDLSIVILSEPLNNIAPAVKFALILTNFDFSLFGIFINGFYGLFSDPFNMVLMLFTILILMIFDVSGCLIAFSNLCGFVNKETNGF